MPYVSGFLRVRGRGHADHELPEGEVDPGWGVTPPIDPGFGGGLPAPPPGLWPPPNATLPIVPAPPDTPPGAIWPPIGHPPSWGGGIPARPPVISGGPATPPGRPARPDAGLPTPPGAHPGGGPATPPGRPPSVGGGPATPPGLHPGGGPVTPPPTTKPIEPPTKFWIVAGIPGVGWKYVCVDPSLQPGTKPIEPDEGTPPVEAQTGWWMHDITTSEFRVEATQSWTTDSTLATVYTDEEKAVTPIPPDHPQAVFKPVGSPV